MDINTLSRLECIVAGACPDCRKHPVLDGPYTEERVRDIADDLGCEVDEVGICCSLCFINEVGGGNVALAQKYAGMPLDPHPSLLAIAAGEGR